MGCLPWGKHQPARFTVQAEHMLITIQGRQQMLTRQQSTEKTKKSPKSRSLQRPDNQAPGPAGGTVQPAEVKDVTSVGPACPECPACPAGWVGPVRSSPGAGGWVGPVSAAVSSGMSRKVAAAFKMGTIRVEAATRAKPGPRALIRDSHGPLPVGAAEANPGQWHRTCVQEAVGCWHQGHPPERRRRVGG